MTSRSTPASSNRRTARRFITTSTNSMGHLRRDRRTAGRVRARRNDSAGRAPKRGEPPTARYPDSREAVAMVRRFRLVAAAAALVAALALPGSAQALPNPEESCAAYGSFAYAMPLPGAMRTPGVHHVDWRATFVDEFGVLQVFENTSQIEIVPGSPAYVGEVLLRIR